MHSRKTMRPADVPRVCEACGTSFLAWQIRARACSKRCQLRLWRRTQPKKPRRGSTIPILPPTRLGLSEDPQAIYRRNQQRDQRRRNRELFLERERQSRAKVPRAIRQRRQRDYNLKQTYGKAFGIAQYEALLVTQLGGCAICGASPEPSQHLHVDHDHTTNIIRGLLCHHCNMGMIAVDACADWLDRARGYIERHTRRI